VWFNEGGEAFYPRPQLLAGDGSYDCKLIDMDGDSDLDLVLSDGANGQHKIFSTRRIMRQNCEDELNPFGNCVRLMSCELMSN